MKDIFNTAAQGLKDTVNGFHFDNLGWLNVGVTGWNTYIVGASLAAGSIPVLSLIFAGIGYYLAHRDGSARRLSHQPPRWWP